MKPDLQRISVKVLADTPPGFNLDIFLPVFDRWRKEIQNPEHWIDLADYVHMVQGPGILLAGTRGNFGANMDAPGFGLLYAGKNDFEGSVEARFLQAFQRALALQSRFVKEPEFPADVQARAGDWVVTVNDRLRFPNNGETDALIKPGLEAAVKNLFGDSAVQLARDEHPDRRLAYRLAADGSADLHSLLERAAAALG